jgi:hypothetical protein
VTLRLSPSPGAVRRGLSRQGSMRSVVIVIVLPFFELLIEEVNVVRNPVAVEELVELLIVDAMRSFDLPFKCGVRGWMYT